MLSDFDRGMLEAEFAAVLVEMPDTITLQTDGGNFILNCVITSRTVAQKNIQGGKSREVSGSVNVIKRDFLSAGGNINGGQSIVFSDQLVGKISLVEDCAGAIATLVIGPVLQGAAGPQGGHW